ncbi:MAG: DUF3084 domain-containing protein [Armatimonadetes bacterium]|nr:DUF3084 domain-containing protein [Armatimonadota bacterium]
MGYTVLFVMALILVSGFIAYFGDILGRRMGKKRLMLFGLRPRYTAIVVTTITGMLISALVLGAALSMNAEFRKGFFQYSQILKRSTQLAKQNNSLAVKSQELKSQVAKQKSELATALKDAALAKKQRDEAGSKVESLKKEIDKRQKELSDLQKKQDIAEAELAQRKDELKLMLIQLDQANQALRLAQSKLVEAQQQLMEAEARLGATEAKLRDTTAKLADAEVAASLGDLGTLMAVRLRIGEITFKRGDELTRGLIKSNQTPFALRGDIISLLDRASSRASARNARTGANGRAINLIYWPDPENREPIDSEPECIDIAARRIASTGSEALVQVVCAMNTLTDAQVPVEMRIYHNRQVFSAGDKIASVKIDPSESDGQILLQLSDFLQKDVAKAAAEAGVVPVYGQDPRMFLGDDRHSQMDELLNVLAGVKQLNGGAKVNVYATEAIRPADTLNVHNIRIGIEKSE